jgi:hypothetical protein
VFRVLAAASIAASVAGCTSDSLTTGTVGFAPGSSAGSLLESGSDAAYPAYEDNASYAGRAVYRCDDGENLEVSNTISQVVIAKGDGSTMELPASPADSHTRYVKDQFAIVFDGEEALFFRPKAAPATCRR